MKNRVLILFPFVAANTELGDMNSSANVLVSVLPWIVLLATFGLLVMLLVWIRASLNRYAEHTKRMEDLLDRIAKVLEERNKNDN